MSTPLMLAAKHGHAGVVTALLNAGAGDEILAAEHALLLACIRGHKETVWRLLKKVRVASVQGQTRRYFLHRTVKFNQSFIYINFLDRQIHSTSEKRNKRF